MKKILFIDRDGTINMEPNDQQVDRLDKIRLTQGVIPALLQLQAAGYELVMISNQDGLGTDSFARGDFDLCQNFILDLLHSQGIQFQEILICPHFAVAACDCRKPRVGLVLKWLREPDWDRQQSVVIGDRDTDMQLAENMGIRGIRLDSPMAAGLKWNEIVRLLLTEPRIAAVNRQTTETAISLLINLDASQPVKISTGIGFLDHMLEQLARHSGISIELKCTGDLTIDDHHSIEDIGLSLGKAIRQALGDKLGIARYGFSLPMDEAEAHVLLDLSGRPYSIFNATFHREKIGDLSTEMIPHFFRSLAESLGANLHIRATGDNDHHIAEGIFKAFAKSLGQAITKNGSILPSTKGIL